MVKTIAQIKRTNLKNVVHQMVVTHANRRTLNVLVENAFRADGSAIMNRTVMTTVMSMPIVL